MVAIRLIASLGLAAMEQGVMSEVDPLLTLPHSFSNCTSTFWLPPLPADWYLWA